MYLIKVNEVYRVDSESEAIDLINSARRSTDYKLINHSAIKKEKKSKGEIIDEWWKVTLVKEFDDEKEPTGCTTIEYNTSGSAF